MVSINGCRYEHTHWAELAQHPQHQDGFEQEEQNQANQREELVQHVEADVAVVAARHARVEMAGPRECRVKGDISSTNEQSDGRGGN